MTEQQRKSKQGGRRTPAGGAPRGNKNALKGRMNRKKWGNYLAVETIEKIKALAIESGLSQGEVVDRLVASANLKELKTE